MGPPIVYVHPGWLVGRLVGVQDYTIKYWMEIGETWQEDGEWECWSKLH